MAGMKFRGSEFTWDEQTRVMRIRYAPGTVLDDSYVAPSMAFLEACGEPELFLIDCGGLRDATPAYRNAFGAYFRARKDRARMALYNLNGFVRVMATLFGKATGIPMRAFRDEDEAMRWLQAAEARA